MDEDPGKIPDSLIRVLVVTAALVALGAFVVLALIPESAKDVRVQWAAAVQRERGLPLAYAGAGVCAECHDEVASTKTKGDHRDLSCETCHGPARAHADDPEKTRPVIPETRSFCPRCHGYDPSRPKGFPMIRTSEHNPLQPCQSCHDPHDPKPPVPPKKCSACHGEIARAVSFSRHALLDCATCHDTPARHRISPRTVRPGKPRERVFCGKCHGEGGKDKLASRAPKVDIALHGGKYVCWQCHYPHSPEAGR